MAYIGIGNIAKKIKNCYIGVDGIAKKVSKAYIGINGIARLWWSTAVECPLVYSGRIGDMSSGKRNAARASNNNYLFIACGGPRTGSSYVTNTVDKYNLAGTRSSCSTYPLSTYDQIAISGTDYALFAGGYSYDTSAGTNYVRAYNTSGTQVSPSSLSYVRRGSNAMEEFAHNRYNVLGGGIAIRGTNLEGSSVNFTTIVEQAEYYSSTLTKTVASTTFLRDITGSSNCFSSQPWTGVTADKNYIIVGGGNIWDRQTLGDIVSETNTKVYAYNSGWSKTALTSFPSDISMGYFKAYSLSNGVYLLDTGYDDDWHYDNNLVLTRLVNPFWISYESDAYPVVVGDHIVGFGDYGETITYVFTVIDKNGIFTYCPTPPSDEYKVEGDYIQLGGFKNRLFVWGGKVSSKVCSTIVEAYDIIT